jgi:hypothetical protein
MAAAGAHVRCACASRLSSGRRASSITLSSASWGNVEWLGGLARHGAGPLCEGGRGFGLCSGGVGYDLEWKMCFATMPQLLSDADTMARLMVRNDGLLWLRDHMKTNVKLTFVPCHNAEVPSPYSQAKRCVAVRNVIEK